MLNIIKVFVKKNRIICGCFIVALAIIVLYILTLNVTVLFPHAGDLFQILLQLAIGFVVSFVFYITQFFIPERKRTQQANKCIQDRIQNIVGKMDDVFRRIFEKYNAHYEKNNVTNETFLEVFHKMVTNDRINVVAARRSWPERIDENSYYTVKEWIITRLEFVEHEIDCIFKYYSAYVTPELMNVLEKILGSTMHQNVARITLQSPVDLSFEKCSEDYFFKPYFDLMMELESLKDQYR